MSTDTKWSHSSHEDWFCEPATFDTKEAAIAHGLDYYYGERFYVGRVVPAKIADLLDQDLLEEFIEEVVHGQLYDRTGCCDHETDCCEVTITPEVMAALERGFSAKVRNLEDVQEIAAETAE